MAIAMLRMDKAKDKWSLKLQSSFYDAAAKDRLHRGSPISHNSSEQSGGSGSGGKYSLFLLPFVTVLREGVGM